MALPRLALVLALALAGPLVAPVLADGSGASGAADDRPRVSVAEFGTVLQIDALFDVLREEGLAQAEDLAATLLPTARSPSFDHAVDQIYDLKLLRARFNQILRLRLAADPALTAEAQAFFATDLGQRVIALEIEARRAFLDIVQEEAARVAADTPETARDPKWGLIRRIVAAGDLVEVNVSAGLSGSLGFAQGLQETGVYGLVRPLDDLVSEVWAQEAQIRADAGAWLKAYLGLAYAPLTEAELTAYVEFLESPAGRHYTSTLSQAFAETFRPVSRAMGRAVGLAAQVRDI